MAKLDKGLVARAAALLMAVQVLSRVLGYVRESVLLNIFGQGYATDAYNAAFLIPDFFYSILIGGAIGTAFIPVFSSYITKNQEEEAWRVSSIFSSWSLSIMLLGLALAAVFAYPLMTKISSFAPDAMQMPVLLTRIVLIQSLLMAISAIVTGILQSHQHFFWPAMSVLIYNVLIIVAGLLLVGPIEARWPGYGIAGFCVGVVVSALLSVLVQIPMLKKVGFRYRPCFDIHHPGFRQMIKLLIPVLIGLSVTQINLIVTQKLATGLGDGIYTALRNANRFMQLPLGVFAVSIMVAFFPSMTRQAALGEMDEMKHSLSLALRTILFLMLPASAGLIVLRVPIFRLMFEFSDKFTAADTAVAAQALLYYCIGLAFYGAVTALLRGFYAIQNTLTPLLISIFAIAVNVAFAFLLVGPMGHRGLALAYSLSGIAQCLLALYFLRRRIGRMDLRHILISAAKSLLATVLMAVAVWGAAALAAAVFGIGSKLGQLIQVLAGVGVGVAVFLAAAWLMKMEEVQLVLNLFKRKFRRKQAAAE